MRRYWTARVYQDVKTSKTFFELSCIAIRILRRMPQPIGQVCGPITTGGLGSTRKNIQLFRRIIKKIGRKYNIFDQMPFEEHFQRIIKTKHFKNENQLLQEFYFPIFNSGFVETLYFVYGWETSFGARWEKKQGKRLGLKIVFLPKNFTKPRRSRV